MTVPLDIMSLHGKTISAAVRGAVNAPPSVDQSIDVAGQVSIVVSDPHRRMTDVGGLLSDSAHGLVHSAPRLKYGSATYVLAAMSKTGDDYKLDFEDQIPDWLRQYRSFIKATRKKTPEGPGVTAAEFIHRMVLEPRKQGRKIAFRCPELHDFQKPEDPEVTAAADASGQDATLTAGITPGASSSIKVKGAAANPGQVQVMTEAFNAAKATSPPALAMLALFEAGTAENEWTTGEGRGADAISSGFLQLIRSLHGTKSTAEQATLFMTTGFTGAGGANSLAKAHPEWPAHKIAQTVQGSGAGASSEGASNYGPWQAESLANLQVFGVDGGDVTATAGTAGTTVTDYEFTRGQPGEPEDSWTCMGRIADERAWKRFAVQNLLTYASEPRLYEQKARASISEYDNGVGHIDFDWRPRRRVNSLKTTVHMKPNFLVPGQIIVVTDPGPVNGRWLITRVTQDGDSNLATIEARKPQRPKPEPANATAAAAVDGTTAAGAVGSGTLFEACKAISDAHGTYVYGGGHTMALTSLTATNDQGGLDCSSSTSLALFKAGMFTGSHAIVSGEFAASWGQPGKGTDFTVWANAEHVFIEFHGANAGYQFNTAGHPNDRGPRLLKQSYGTSGFTPRHWAAAAS